MSPFDVAVIRSFALVSYDPVGRLKSYTQDLTGSTNDLIVNGPGAGGTAITYNPASQLTGLTRSNDLYAWTGHYNVNRAYGTNGLNQLTSAGAATLGYDGRGNLTTSVTTTNSSIYGYTSENRLATVNVGANATTLTYDPTGRLSRLDTGVVVTKFEYLGPRLISERDAAGNILRRYVHGPGDDEPVVWHEGPTLSNKRFLHTDERGSVIAVTDATGASIATNTYDEYGIPQSSVGTLSPRTSGRFMYTGQTWIPEVGLYYYKARFYSPTLGRFMQTDPIGYKDGINWYGYVANDPVNKIDSSGFCGRDKNGSEIGLCGNDATSTNRVDSRLGDGHSIATDVDSIAQGKGLRVGYQEKSNDANNDAATYHPNQGSGGTIKIDPSDKVTYTNPDGTTYTPSVAEAFEHELNNARNEMLGVFPKDDGTGEHAGSIDAENRYRSKSGIEFKRTPST